MGHYVAVECQGEHSGALNDVVVYDSLPGTADKKVLDEAVKKWAPKTNRVVHERCPQQAAGSNACAAFACAVAYIIASTHSSLGLCNLKALHRLQGNDTQLRAWLTNCIEQNKLTPPLEFSTPPKDTDDDDECAEPAASASAHASSPVAVAAACGCGAAMPCHAMVLIL